MAVLAAVMSDQKRAEMPCIDTSRRHVVTTGGQTPDTGADVFS